MQRRTDEIQMVWRARARTGCRLQKWQGTGKPVPQQQRVGEPTLDSGFVKPPVLTWLPTQQPLAWQPSSWRGDAWQTRPWPSAPWHRQAQMPAQRRKKPRQQPTAARQTEQIWWWTWEFLMNKTRFVVARLSAAGPTERGLGGVNAGFGRPVDRPVHSFCGADPPMHVRQHGENRARRRRANRPKRI